MNEGPLAAPSPHFAAWREALRDAARLGPLLDVACGGGRHTLASAAAGARAVGLDRDAAALRALARRAAEDGIARQVSAVRADLETGPGLPLRRGCCGAVLVFRYLHRPLAPALAEALAPGGLLLYETFTSRQRDLGHGPRNPAFLLEPGELPTLFPELEIVSHVEVVTAGPRPEALARLVARRRPAEG